MTDWLDKSVKNAIFSTIKKAEQTRGKLTDEQKEEVKEEWQEHFKSQLKLDVEERYFFQDKWGQSVLVIKTPEAMSIKPTSSGSYRLTCTIPLLESQISVFLPISEEELSQIWDQTFLARGRVSEQYKHNNSFYSLDQLLKKFDVSELSLIDVSEYLTYYTLNLSQIIARITG